MSDEDEMLRLAVLISRHEALCYLHHGDTQVRPIPKRLLDRMDELARKSEEISARVYAHDGFTKYAALKAFKNISAKRKDE